MVAVNLIRRILIVGFMASGKTSVGQELANLLEWKFHDFDSIIEDRTGITISEIFCRDGEEHFRKLESDLALELFQEEQVILASGGGWPSRPGNWECVPDGTLSIWLRVSPEVAVKRASSGGPTRPMLAGEDPLGSAIKLLEQREDLYGRAQITLNSDNCYTSNLATKIMNIVIDQKEQE